MRRAIFALSLLGGFLCAVPVAGAQQACVLAPTARSSVDPSFSPATARRLTNQDKILRGAATVMRASGGAVRMSDDAKGWTETVLPSAAPPTSLCRAASVNRIARHRLAKRASPCRTASASRTPAARVRSIPIESKSDLTFCSCMIFSENRFPLLGIML